MKTIFFVYRWVFILYSCLLVIMPDNALAQWIWMHGDSSLNSRGIYGTRGMPSPANKPGHRYYPACWTDTAGSFWLLGGLGFDRSGTPGYQNDLWKFNPSANEWTWMHGDNTVGQYGVYGTRGISSPAGKPGARQSATTWTDAAGCLWLFGGVGYAASGPEGALNDLWKYSPFTQQWTWVDGDSSTFRFGTYSRPGAAGKPGGRADACGWTDSADHLWLFGGYGNASTAYGYLNDVWQYNPAAGQWIWAGGDSVCSQNGQYGNKGVAAAGNMPGGRFQAAVWTDAAGNAWLFGGSGLAASGGGDYLGDVWRYEPAVNTWTWVGGDSTIDQPGNYGRRGDYSLAGQPGSRNSMAHWKDSAGCFWLFGGIGHDAADGSGFLNDLWKFNPATQQWCWMGGDNRVFQSDVYGARGMMGKANRPGGRYGTAGWRDPAGNFWLFGGYGSPPSGKGYLNDLWRYGIAVQNTTIQLPSKTVP